MNELLKIYEAFPDEEWDFNRFVANPNLTFEYIDSHLELKEKIFPNWTGTLSKNPNLTLKYVLDNNTEWDWFNISANPGITLEDIENNPELNWRWKYIGKNPNITMDFILKHKEHFSTKDECQYLGSTPNITIENIIAYPELFWRKEQIASNPNLTLDFILEYFEDNDFRSQIKSYELGKNLNVSPQQIFDNTNLLNNKRFMEGILTNPNFTFDDLQNIDLYSSVYLDYMCLNPSITIEQLFSYKLVEKSNIFANPNLTLDWILNNRDIELTFNHLSGNQFHCHEYFKNQIVIRI